MIDFGYCVTAMRKAIDTCPQYVEKGGEPRHMDTQYCENVHVN